MSARCSALALALVVVTGGCDEPDAQSDMSETGDTGSEQSEPIEWEPPAATTLHYVSTWDWTGAEQQDGEWVFETDLGTRVGVELGYLATATLMLVLCAEADAAAGLDFRSHSTVSDESLLLGPWIEDFGHGPSEHELGVGQTSGARYCALHWFATPVDDAADDGYVLNQTSIAVTGWYEGADGARHEFDATVGLSAGGLRLLESVELPESGEAATVRLIRRPARALDGVEVEGRSESELAFEFIQGLARSSSAWIEPTAD